MASRWKSVGETILWLAFGLAAIGAAWGMWNEFRQLEAGELSSMKLWAPLAWIYNLGGIWSALAKWLSITMLGLLGLVLIAASVKSLISDGEDEQTFAEVNQDARYDLSVTTSQIEQEETMDIQGPNGLFHIKLQKGYQDQDRLRFAGEGFGKKGDLYVVIQVRG